MLKLHRRQKGGNYYIRGTVQGQRIYESTGTGHRATAEAIAKRRSDEIHAAKAHGRDHLITFAEAAATYMETGGEARFLGPIIRFFGPDMRLAEVDNAAVNRAAAKIYPNASAATINRQLITPVSAVVTLAADEGLTHYRKFRRRKGDVARTRWLTPEESERLIAAADPHLVPVLGMLLGGGCRVGEALTIDAALYYPATGEAYLPATKNGHPRMVKFPRRAQHMIAAAGIPEAGPICRTPKGRAYVIRENGGGQISGAFRKAADLAGLGADVTPHVLRHTWATWYYSQTRDFGGLLDLGGWRKADMAQRYRKIAPADLSARLMAHGWDFTQTGAGPAYAVGATSTHSAARAELGNVSVLRSAKVTSQKTR